MPRYTIVISSSKDPRKRRSTWAWKPTLFEAERYAVRWLEVARLTSMGPTGFDCWTVARKVSPHAPAEILSRGGLSD